MSLVYAKHKCKDTNIIQYTKKKGEILLSPFESMKKIFRFNAKIQLIL